MRRETANNFNSEELNQYLMKREARIKTIVILLLGSIFFFVPVISDANIAYVFYLHSSKPCDTVPGFVSVSYELTSYGLVYYSQPLNYYPYDAFQFLPYGQETHCLT